MMRGETPTPSMPQCRVTPLCNSSDSGGYGAAAGVSGALIMCPLLPPAPICDTFSSNFPEEMGDPLEQYGFSYGTLSPPLDIQGVEETPFTDFSRASVVNTMTQTGLNGDNGHLINEQQRISPGSCSHSYSTQMTNTVSSSECGGTNTPTSNGPGSQTRGTDTLKRQAGKNQYWV